MTKTAQRRLNEAQSIVDKFNKAKPIGSPVTYYELIDPPAKPFHTNTRTEAWVMGGHSAMVMVEGISGGVCVDHIQDFHNA